MMRLNLKDFYFTIDLRSLGVFRILLGLLLIWDWLLRWPDLEAFYTSFGVWPVEAVLPKPGGEFHFCLLDGVTSLAMVRLAFCAGLTFYVLFLAGFRTRLFHVLSFLFFVSVQSRNVMIRDASVVVLGTMLMWSLFLPLGRRFSLDNFLGRVPAAEDSLRSRPSLAAFVIIAQIGLIYFFTAVAKYGDTWKNGTALYYALNVDQFVRPFGKWVAGRPLGLLQGLSWAVLGLEYAALPLFLFPLGQPWLRRIGIVALILLHLGIGAMMHLGFFAAVMISTFTLLLLPRDWDSISACKLGRTVQEWFVSASSKLRSWKLVESMRSVGGANTVAEPAFFSRISFWSVNSAVAVLFLTFTLDAYNINMSKAFGRERIGEPRWMRALIEAPLLEHNWEMFAPDPMREDGWWVIDGETECGEKLDPLTGQPPTFEKPVNLGGHYDRFWRKYLERVWLKKNYDHRLYFGKYITRKNHREYAKGQRLVRFSFYYIKEHTQPPGTAQPWPTERVLLWRHECFDKKASD